MPSISARILVGDYEEAQVINILTDYFQCNITLNCLHLSWASVTRIKKINMKNSEKSSHFKIAERNSSDSQYTYPGLAKAEN